MPQPLGGIPSSVFFCTSSSSMQDVNVSTFTSSTEPTPTSSPSFCRWEKALFEFVKPLRRFDLTTGLSKSMNAEEVPVRLLKSPRHHFNAPFAGSRHLHHSFSFDCDSCFHPGPCVGKSMNRWIFLPCCRTFAPTFKCRARFPPGPFVAWTVSKQQWCYHHRNQQPRKTVVPYPDQDLLHGILELKLICAQSRSNRTCKIPNQANYISLGQTCKNSRNFLCFVPWPFEPSRMMCTHAGMASAPENPMEPLRAV